MHGAVKGCVCVCVCVCVCFVCGACVKVVPSKSQVRSLVAEAKRGMVGKPVGTGWAEL